MDSAPLETDNSTRVGTLVKESQSLSLGAFAGYYGHRFPQCALIDEIGPGEETKGEDSGSEANGALIPGESVNSHMYRPCFCPYLAVAAHRSGCNLAGLITTEQSRTLS